MKLSSTALLALAISSVTASAYAETQSQAFTPVTVNTKSAQADATGFIEGSTVTGSTRNWYANEQLKRGGKFAYKKDGVSTPTDRRINWVQGTIVKYNSGFTEGTVGSALKWLPTTPSRWNATARTWRPTTVAHRALVQARAQPYPDQRRRRRSRSVEQTRPGQRQGPCLQHHFDRRPHELQQPSVDAIGNRPLPSSFEGVAIHSEELNNLSFDLAILRPRFAAYRTEPVEVPHRIRQWQPKPITSTPPA